VGEFCKGEPEGLGTLTLTNFDKVKVNWTLSEMKGEGKYTWASGESTPIMAESGNLKFIEEKIDYPV